MNGLNQLRLGVPQGSRDHVPSAVSVTDVGQSLGERHHFAGGARCHVAPAQRRREPRWRPLEVGEFSIEPPGTRFRRRTAVIGDKAHDLSIDLAAQVPGPVERMKSRHGHRRCVAKVMKPRGAQQRVVLGGRKELGQSMRLPDNRLRMLPPLTERLDQPLGELFRTLGHCSRVSRDATHGRTSGRLAV